MTSPDRPARLNRVLLGPALLALLPLRQALDLDHLDAELLLELDRTRGSRV